jgi:hypothetical protein
MQAVLILGEFLYALAHHPLMAVLIGVSLVIAGRGALLVRLFILAVLIAIIHDCFTGQLWSELK